MYDGDPSALRWWTRVKAAALSPLRAAASAAAVGASKGSAPGNDDIVAAAGGVGAAGLVHPAAIATTARMTARSTATLWSIGWQAPNKVAACFDLASGCKHDWPSPRPPGITV